MRYPLSSQQSISPEAVEAAVTVLRSGKFTMGAQVAQFEHDFAKWVGSKHAVMVNSGSSANLLAIEALVKPSPRIPIREGWGPGCEVLVPALQAVAGPAALMTPPPQMGAEDFAYFQQRIPGFYFFVGVANPKRNITAMVHTEYFDIDEAALAVGMRAMATAVADYLYRAAAR